MTAPADGPEVEVAPGIPAELAELAVPVASLRPYRKNPRVGDVAAIAGSLRAHGQYRPVVVNRRTGEVLAGNHTLAAAVELGWPELAATFVDVDDDEAARIVLVDNRSSDLARYDEAALAELLGSLDGLEGGLVLDLFGGSGSTLIAAHHAGQRAALVELDPRYVDVICRRYQEHAGVVPVRDGVPVDFVAAGA